MDPQTSYDDLYDFQRYRSLEPARRHKLVTKIIKDDSVTVKTMLEERCGALREFFGCPANLSRRRLADSLAISESDAASLLLSALRKFREDWELDLLTLQVETVMKNPEKKAYRLSRELKMREHKVKTIRSYLNEVASHPERIRLVATRMQLQNGSIVGDANPQLGTATVPPSTPPPTQQEPAQPDQHGSHLLRASLPLCLVNLPPTPVSLLNTPISEGNNVPALRSPTPSPTSMEIDGNPEEIGPESRGHNGMELEADAGVLGIYFVSFLPVMTHLPDPLIAPAVPVTVSHAAAQFKVAPTASYASTVLEPEPLEQSIAAVPTAWHDEREEAMAIESVYPGAMFSWEGERNPWRRNLILSAALPKHPVFHAASLEHNPWFEDTPPAPPLSVPAKARVVCETAQLPMGKPTIFTPTPT